VVLKHPADVERPPRGVASRDRKIETCSKTVEELIGVNAEEGRHFFARLPDSGSDLVHSRVDARVWITENDL
jgi:hypothetical protein